jgi:hypothetical protein
VSHTARGFNNFFKKPSEPETTASKQPEEPEFVDGAYDEDDPVEKIFGFFFGKREEAPLGLSRMTSQKFPEQYPAVTDEWAEPVATDNKEMAAVRPVLKNTNLERRALKLSYSANKNGWSALNFHQAVDRKGGALVVCTTRDGLLCGGYNPKGWVGFGENRGSIAAFLFVQNPNGSFTKLRKVGGAGMAQMDYPEMGVSFGADSLVIPLNGDKVARSKLGSYYERFEDGTNTLFRDKSAVELKDLKVYHGVYEEGEFIPHTDAEPFALN